MIKSLGGVVEGKRHTYTIQVEFVKPSDPDRVELSRIFEVTTSDESGKRRVEQLELQQGQSDVILYDFVAMTKRSAERDFDEGVV